MDQPRPCGCKGCRTCLLCESQYGINRKTFIEQFKDQQPFVFCPDCNQLFPGWDVSAVLAQHPSHENVNGVHFDGVYVQNDFITAAEAVQLMKGIDEMPWVASQSGRRKQNFGPKTNFKKMKLALGTFGGFPAFSEFVQSRFRNVPLLRTFQTIEQCSLEYDPNKGASIDPHIDDCWIWGERVVTVNCLSDSVLTLSLYQGDSKRYNLPIVESYRTNLLSDLQDAESLKQRFGNCVIRLPMPNRSLMVLYGPARYQWEHCVLREDIIGRRVCVAYREFTPPYLSGNNDDRLRSKSIAVGHAVLEQSKVFWDHLNEQCRPVQKVS